MSDQIRVAILGYGNLGRGVECAIRQNPDMELFGVFTRRAPETVQTLTGAKVYAASEVEKYEAEIMELEIQQFILYLESPLATNTEQIPALNATSTS